MPRASTGTVHWHWSAELQRECWHGRWTRWDALDPDIPRTDEAAARACADDAGEPQPAMARRQSHLRHLARGAGARRHGADVLGHTDIKMTDKYLRNASAVRGGAFGEVFPALPPMNRHRNVSDASGFAIQPKNRLFSGVDGTRTRGLRRDRPAL